MATREQADLFFGHPGFDQQPTRRPVAEEDSCGRCRHPRWMHAGAEAQFGTTACHQHSWDADLRCGCVRFAEPHAGPKADEQ